MNQNELNDRIRFLVQSPYNTQEFMNLASFPDHWKAIDKEITLPGDVGFTELDCPVCFETVRLIYEKFAAINYALDLTCPHCKEKIRGVGEFTGYTNEITLEEI